MKKTGLFFLSFIFHLTVLFAQDNISKSITDVTLFKTNLQKANGNIQTIESDFVQEKNLSLLSEKINSKGHFYFKKKNLLRWEYTLPYNYTIVINKDKLTIKDDKRKNEFNTKSNKMFKEINNIMIGSIDGTLLNDTKNYKTEYFEEKEMYKVKIIPLKKELKEMLNFIIIYFEKKDYSVSKVNMQELSGDNTIIIFSNKKLNTPISDEKFIIK